MLLISRKLSKLAVSAYLVCVLMVIICGTRVLCVRLYNDCSKENIAVDSKGRVYAFTKHIAAAEDYQNLTITSSDYTGKLTIFAEKSRKYLCFTWRWKLKGLKKHSGDRCLFYEEMLANGYTRYRSTADQTRYLGFNQKGIRMNDTRQPNISARMQKCLNFLKLDTDFDISEHNTIVGRANISDNVVRHRKLCRQLSTCSTGGANRSRQNRGTPTRHNKHHQTHFSAPSSPMTVSQQQRTVRIRHRNHHQGQNLNDIT